MVVAFHQGSRWCQACLNGSCFHHRRSGHGVPTLRHVERPEELPRKLYRLIEIGSFHGFRGPTIACASSASRTWRNAITIFVAILSVGLRGSELSFLALVERGAAVHGGLDLVAERPFDERGAFIGGRHRHLFVPVLRRHPLMTFVVVFGEWRPLTPRGQLAGPANSTRFAYVGLKSVYQVIRAPTSFRHCSQYPIPPMLPLPAGRADSFEGMSAIIASAVIRSAAIEPASCKAVRTTFAGSTMPALIIST